MYVFLWAAALILRRGRIPPHSGISRGRWNAGANRFKIFGPYSRFAHLGSVVAQRQFAGAFCCINHWLDGPKQVYSLYMFCISFAYAVLSDFDRLRQRAVGNVSERVKISAPISSVSTAWRSQLIDATHAFPRDCSIFHAAMLPKSRKWPINDTDVSGFQTDPSLHLLRINRGRTKRTCARVRLRAKSSRALQLQPLGH